MVYLEDTLLALLIQLPLSMGVVEDMNEWFERYQPKLHISSPCKVGCPNITNSDHTTGLK
jgi:hypothetical protein